MCRGGWERWGCSVWRKEGSGGLTHVYKYLMGWEEGKGARLLLEVPSDRTRGNGNNLKHVKFHLSQENTFLLFKHRNTLPREIEKVLSMETLKISLAMMPSNLLQLTCLEQGCWTKKSQSSPFQPKRFHHFVIKVLHFFSYWQHQSSYSISYTSLRVM